MVVIKGEWYWKHFLINATANLGSKNCSEQYVNVSLEGTLKAAPEHGIFFLAKRYVIFILGMSRQAETKKQHN